MNYPGGRQVGIGAKLLRSLPWYDFRPHPEWVEPHWRMNDYHRPSAAGIPGRLRIVYMPALWNPPRLTKLEQDVAYRLQLVNPSTGEMIPRQVIHGDRQGNYQLGHLPEQRDWVIILRKD